MDINNVIQELDQLYAQKRMSEAETLLLTNLEDADSVGDVFSAITIMNELIGLYRDRSRYKESSIYCQIVVQLMRESGLEDTVPYATTLINVANAYRAAGKLQESLEIYKHANRIYKDNLAKDDLNMASLNNNIGLLYQAMGEYTSAYEYLESARKILEQYPNTNIEMAITHTNIGTSLIKLEKVQEACKHIENAIKIFDQGPEPKDFHYSAALSAMGEVQYKMKNYEKAIEYFAQSLREIKANMGENMTYATTCNNMAIVYDVMGNQEEAIGKRAIAKEIKDTFDDINN